MPSGRATVSTVRAWVANVWGVRTWDEMCLPLKLVWLPSLSLEFPSLHHWSPDPLPDGPHPSYPQMEGHQASFGSCTGNFTAGHSGFGNENAV